MEERGYGGDDGRVRRRLQQHAFRPLGRITAQNIPIRFGTNIPKAYSDVPC
jgi:hypothetical protein